MIAGSNQLNKTQRRYDRTQTIGSSHIVKRNSNTGSNVIKPHEELKRRDENISQKTAGLLRIPDLHALVDEGMNRWREFNTTKGIWPSIDVKEDENGTMSCGIKSYSSILRATPQFNMPSLPVDNKVYHSLK